MATTAIETSVPSSQTFVMVTNTGRVVESSSSSSSSSSPTERSKAGTNTTPTPTATTATTAAAATTTTTKRRDDDNTPSTRSSKKESYAIRNDNGTMKSPSSSPSSTLSSTPTLTMRDVRYALMVYFFLPLSLLAVSSFYYDYRLTVFLDETRNDDDINTTKSITISPPSNAWILGFDSSTELWYALYDRTVSVACWGLTYIFVRKGCNPTTGENFLARYGMGTVLTTLSVFYSTFGRILLYRHVLTGPRSIETDAVLVGLTWAIANALIRRRLDPHGRRTLWHFKTQRDLFLGGLAFAIGSYGRSVSAPHVVPVLKDFCQTHVPVPAYALHLIDVVADVPSHKFWSVTVQACLTSFWYGVPYLLIRRACNPDSYRTKSLGPFVRTHGSDALFGSLALIVGVYLKHAASKWVPIAYLAVLRWFASRQQQQQQSTTTTIWDADLDETLGDEL